MISVIEQSLWISQRGYHNRFAFACYRYHYLRIGKSNNLVYRIIHRDQKSVRADGAHIKLKMLA